MAASPPWRPSKVAQPPFAFALAPTRKGCAHQNWTLARCCSPELASRLRMHAKWPQLDASMVNAVQAPFPWDVGHVNLVEPLSISAFASAIDAWRQRATARVRGFILDVGMNAGIYTWLGSAIAPELDLVGVDLQPLCVQVAECGLRLLHRGGMPSNVHLLRRYVTGNASNRATISMPDNQCGKMVSPTSPRGRSPAGRVFSVRPDATHRVMLPVRPIALGDHLLKHFGSDARAAVVKIDVRRSPSLPTAAGPCHA